MATLAAGKKESDEFRSGHDIKTLILSSLSSLPSLSGLSSPFILANLKVLLE